MEQITMVGAAFEDLTESEMMEVDGGAAWTSVLTSTTLACIGASIVIGGAVSLTLTVTICK
ncbi:hypothetical protein [Paenibacillus sp. FJAT-27812]|uniref:hypothetical protein n=1 Tax=Paenibacillus sp. FJAT-27812 TaxID=1684143 RepID=UPI0006A76885|nr:hypothetical protein [Paenibacillus sp. FJAT-27812]